MYLDPLDASLASANELITQMKPDLGKPYFDTDTCLSVFVYAFARHENYIILGMTDPKTIDPSLLHPWLRKCFRNPNLEKQIAKDNGDIDVYTVSRTRLRFSKSSTMQYSATVQCTFDAKQKKIAQKLKRTGKF